MHYTVSDFAHAYAANLTVVAGSGGMARIVREVGILDYELMPGLKQTYQRVNFYEGQLVLATFVYAKDNPYLIHDAVKYLVSKGVSGLVVKNVLHLPIPDATIRYANSRNFPLFTLHGEAFFDQMILDVGQAVRRTESSVQVERAIDALLQANGSEEAARRARAVVPSLGEEMLALYCRFEGEITAEQFSACEAAFEGGPLCTPGSDLMCYRGGVLLIASGDTAKPLDIEAFAEAFRQTVLEAAQEGSAGSGDTGIETGMPCGIGASLVHFGTHELADAVREAMRCASIAQLKGAPCIRYDSLGTLQAILPHADSPAMSGFAERILGRIREFDAESNGQLLDTLQAFCDHGQNVSATAQAMGQHPNTIRYRLEKVQGLTGLSFKDADGMQQLGLACQIDFCHRVLSAVR